MRFTSLVSAFGRRMSIDPPAPRAARRGWVFVMSALVHLGAADSLSGNHRFAPQAASVDGYVLSRDSVPVFGALVSSPSVRQEVRTDSSGYFRLDGFTAGEHTISARSLGFEPVSIGVSTPSDGTVGTTIVLGASIQRLQAVRVIGEGMDDPGRLFALEDFYRRMRRDAGTFITRRDLEGAVTLAPLLAKTPGVRLETNVYGDQSISFARCQPGLGTAGREDPVAYFLDGLRTTGNLLNVFRPQNIEAIEIYRGPSQLPPEAMGHACAAVFIWTRRSP